jgi:hypothetical protein
MPTVSVTCYDTEALRISHWNLGMTCSLWSQGKGCVMASGDFHGSGRTRLFLSAVVPWIYDGALHPDLESAY